VKIGLLHKTPSVQHVTCISCILQLVSACNYTFCRFALHEKYNLSYMSYMHHGHVSYYKSGFTNHNIESGSSFESFIILGLDHNLNIYHSPNIHELLNVICISYSIPYFSLVHDWIYTMILWIMEHFFFVFEKSE